MIIPDHWLVRGAQSAIFYYISCGPCLTVSYQRRRRREAARDRKEKELELIRRPEMYAHPGPAEMNQHWREDIELGPFPPRKRPRKETKDSAAKAAGKLSNATTGDEINGRDVDNELEKNIPTDTRARRSQRADEELEWSPVEGGDKYDATLDYRILRAPPINDLHPAVVSFVPLRPEDRRWMKEPPPSTDFLHGKKGVTHVESPRSWTTSTSAGVEQEGLPNRQAGEISVPAPVLRKVSRGTRRTEKEPQGSSVFRPDSAVSTGGRIKDKANARSHPESSTASSDADDDAPRSSAITRPRPVHRHDTQISRRNSRKTRAGIADRDFAIPSSRPSTTTPPHDSSALIARGTNNENLTPRISPKSTASLASSLSSGDEHLPSPRIRSLKTNQQDDSTTISLPSVIVSKPQRRSSRIERQTTLRPFNLAKADVQQIENVKITTSNPATATASIASTPRATEHERQQHQHQHQHLADAVAGLHLHEPYGGTAIAAADAAVLEQQQHMLQHLHLLSENAAKEQMWLGPRPLRSSVGTPEKRHSVDF